MGLGFNSDYFNTTAYGLQAGSVNTNSNTNDAGKVANTNEIGNRKVQTGIDDPIKETTKQTECQTCKNRRYVDGSDEMVSFKTPQKIAPSAVGSRVRAHEQEHVNNAYNKASAKGGKVLQAAVSLKLAVCPECGKTYVAGGVTRTKIRYENSNPYNSSRQALVDDALKGNNFNKSV